MIDIATYTLIQERLVLLYKRVAGSTGHKSAKFDAEKITGWMQLDEYDTVNWTEIMKQCNVLWEVYKHDVK